MLHYYRLHNSTNKSEAYGGLKIFAKVIIATIISGVIGAFIGDWLLEFPDLGIVFAIAVVGGFIIEKLEERKEK